VDSEESEAYSEEDSEHSEDEEFKCTWLSGPGRPYPSGGHQLQGTGSCGGKFVSSWGWSRAVSAGESVARRREPAPGARAALTGRVVVRVAHREKGGKEWRPGEVMRQPRTQIKRKGNSGDDLHRTAGPSLR
jgi:hypothetical protein